MASTKSTPEPTVHTRLSANDRRDQLVNIAIDLFSRKGFRGTTTREIASAAGVTEAIIFRHFKTKEHLYAAIIDQRLNSPDATAWLAEFRSATEQSDDEAVIRQLVTAIVITHRTEPRFERLMLHAALEGNEIARIYMRQAQASVVDDLRAYFKRRQKQGFLRAMNPDVAMTAIFGMAQHFALCKYIHCFNEPVISDEEAIESFTCIAMNGLCCAKTTNKARAKKK